jgi:hypothetical protein
MMELLEKAGFTHVAVTAPGCSLLADPGSTELDDRIPESFFIEARA